MSTPLGDEDKPAKPAIENMPPEEGVAPPSDDEELDVHDDEFMKDQDATEDPTIDNEERPDDGRD